MASFKTNPISLLELLKDCESGKLRLPDFQRSWVWDEERIRGLLASISEAFPVGALMALETGGKWEFSPRPIQGAENTAHSGATALLLDGQQRMTSLFQTSLRRDVVETISVRQKKVFRFFYLDMHACLDPAADRIDAVVAVDENRRRRWGERDLDLSTREKEFEELMFPVNQIFDWFDWGMAFNAFWQSRGEPSKVEAFGRFRTEVIESFANYRVPVITLDKETSKEAVCLVFEKVNTGGKALDAFELVTAMFAAGDFRLREDWAAREARLKRQWTVLEKITGTEFLQAVSLLATKARRVEHEKAGVEGRNLPAVSATRGSLLKLELADYRRFADDVERGYIRAAQFLHGLRIFKAGDLPYQSQLTPLAAILAELSVPKWENAEIRKKLARWYWTGVFLELYGSAVESRFARDILDVPRWLESGELPQDMVNATFRAERLSSMRSRNSATYKGVNALLMRTGAQDFLSGRTFDETVFADEAVDIHHIFPRDWCRRQTPPIPDAIFDSIINKTPLSARTNRIIGGQAPSAYLAQLERGSAQAPAIASADMDAHLQSHLIPPALLRADAFEAFMEARKAALLGLIADAIGAVAVSAEPDPEDAGEDMYEPDLVAAE